MAFQSDLKKKLKDILKTSSVHLGGNNLLSEIPYFVSTGCTVLDIILGGGIAGGRVVEIFSNESEGKTTLSCGIIASAQRTGGSAIIIDSETTINKERAEMLGINFDDVIIVYASCVEEGFEVIKQTCESLNEDKKRDRTKPYVILWDTIALCPTASSLKSRYAGGMADKARVIREKYSVITIPMAKSGISLIMNNHVIASMTPYSPISTPGGSGTKFAATHRLHLKKAGVWVNPETDKDEGILVRVTVKKNKIASPFRKVEIPFLFYSGAHNDWALFHYAYANDLINRKGSRYHVYKDLIGDEMISFYVKDFLNILLDHPNARLRLITDIANMEMLKEDASRFMDDYLLRTSNV